MTRRTYESYAAIFNYIETHIFALEPNSFITDYEAGLRKAIRRRYPNANLHGCWYHFCAAIRKKYAKLGLFGLCKQDAEANLTKNSLMSLPLLPNDRLEEGFNYIKERAEQHGHAKQFQKLFNYFESYWLKEVYKLNQSQDIGLEK